MLSSAYRTPSSSLAAYVKHMLPMKTVFLIVNKSWEVEPVLNALTSAEFRPKGLPYPNELDSPRRDGDHRATPRATYYFGDAQGIQLRAIIWCLQDVMDLAKSASSSAEKYRVLPTLYRDYAPVDLVVAAGTAASVEITASLNGSVLLGGRFFLHDARSFDQTSTSNLNLPAFDTVLDGGATAALFSLLSAELQAAGTTQRLVPVINLPGPVALPTPAIPQVLIDQHSIALGTLNVLDYNQYDKADAATLTAWAATGTGPAVSVETTHGLIRLGAPAGVPVLFASGIANRVGFYGPEATKPHRYLASFNLGTVLGDMLVALATSTGQW